MCLCAFVTLCSEVEVFHIYNSAYKVIADENSSPAPLRQVSSFLCVCVMLGLAAQADQE